jgi:hypothetical protein
MFLLALYVGINPFVLSRFLKPIRDYIVTEHFVDWLQTVLAQRDFRHGVGPPVELTCAGCAA